ncbi:hypothetical protein [Kineosporia babensis]|uniref:Uncharacterized protein n=1 Tax=Kineosporia babensis TaxID=499548 RepID=A0A9X1NAS6_9ACTN|nr:hypothetical protein [Kineosporia babensis]MCD5310366.1 hypothetical protein [Kineosporia babensis]
MEHPPLTTVLSSVLAAAVENPSRPALLATVIPMPRRPGPEPAAQSEEEQPDPSTAA